MFQYWKSRSAQLQQASSRSDNPVAFDRAEKTANSYNDIKVSRTNVLIRDCSRTDPLKRQDCRFYFYCSGPKRGELEQVVTALPDKLRSTITLGGGLSQTEWIAAMESADVALVTMAPGSETVVMPSKTYSAMMAGHGCLQGTVTN